jgi:hypothetical protein
MSDHLYMPFIYKVTHIVNEQSSGHYVYSTDRSTAFTSSFFFVFLSCRRQIMLPSRWSDRQIDDDVVDNDKEQMIDLDLFGHCCHKSKIRKKMNRKKVIHENKHYTTMLILTIHQLQQNQSIFFFVHILYIYVYIYMEKERRKKKSICSEVTSRAVM